MEKNRSNPEKPMQKAATVGRLRRELFSIANRNIRFKDGSKDYIAFKIEEGERIQPSPVFLPLISSEYTFEAIRNREPDERPQVDFTFGFLQRLSNIPVLPHIAQNAYGLSSEDSVAEAGLSRVERNITFGLQPEEEQLMSCESVAYYDSEGDQLMYSCTCLLTHHSEGYHDQFNESTSEAVWTASGENDDHDLSQFNDLQFSPEAYMKMENVADRTPEDALREWQSLPSFEKRLKLYQDRQRLNMAFGTLASISRAFDEQAGLR